MNPDAELELLDSFARRRYKNNHFSDCCKFVRSSVEIGKIITLKYCQTSHNCQLCRNVLQHWPPVCVSEDDLPSFGYCDNSSNYVDTAGMR